MSNITCLPTAAVSYITIRKAGAIWHVQIVTPSSVPSFPAMQTTVEVCPSAEEATARGIAVAESMRRPFKRREGFR